MLFLLASIFAESIVDTINKDPTSTWVATEYPKSVINRAKFLAMLDPTIIDSPAQHTTFTNDLPEEFDTRTKWPGKIFEQRDQGSCGSAWALVVAGAMGDRQGVAGCGRGVMSPQDLISCDPNNKGCNGGNPFSALGWVQTNGITTDACFPYVSNVGRVPACPALCVNGSAITRYKVSSFAKLTAQQMMQELYENGPISVTFNVQSDFMNYRSGIYKSNFGSYQGTHAVIVIGWGVEDGVLFWRCQNSWGSAWGEKGNFRILRGENHCAIEANPLAMKVIC